MKIFRKYSFDSKELADAAISSLGVDSEGNPTHSHAIVHLGNIVLEQGEYDDEGNETKSPVLSDKYHIDVLWDGDPDASFDSNIVWCPPMGIHVFGNSSAIAEWNEKCRELHPEYFPEPEEIA